MVVETKGCIKRKFLKVTRDKESGFKVKDMEIIYSKVDEPKKDCALPVMLSDETIMQRKEKVLTKMQERKLDKLVVYCDVEHGNNFSYLIGFFTRFEEALSLLNHSIFQLIKLKQHQKEENRLIIK